MWEDVGYVLGVIAFGVVFFAVVNLILWLIHRARGGSGSFFDFDGDDGDGDGDGG